MPFIPEPVEYDAISNLYQRDLNAAAQLKRLEVRSRRGVFIPCVLENGWVWAGGSYARPAYRWYDNDSLEFRGHISPGSSGTVAFTMLPPYRLDHDTSFLTDIVVGGNFSVARAAVAFVTGTVTVTYPAT